MIFQCRCVFTLIYFFNNLKRKISASCFGRGKNERSCTVVFCKNFGATRRPTQDRRLWIWIWMGNFISTASLRITVAKTVARSFVRLRREWGEFDLPRFPPFPSSFFLPPLFHSRFFKSRTPQINLGGLGKRSELSLRGLARSPSRNRIWCILTLKYDNI